MHNLKIKIWETRVHMLWESKSGTQDDWNGLWGERHFLLLPETPQTDLKKLLQAKEIDEIIDHLRESAQLGKEVKDLLEAEGAKKQSAALVSSLLGRLKSSRVNFSAEISSLEQILSEAQRMDQAFNQLKADKSFISDYEKLKFDIAEAKIVLPYLEGEVNRVLAAAKMFDKRVKNAKIDAIQRKAKLTYRVAEDILKEYSRYPFRTPDGEALKESYQSTLKQIEDTKAQLEALKKASKVTLEEVVQLSEQVRNLPVDMGTDEGKLNAEIWRAKYEALVTRHDQLEYKPMLSALKGLISEAEQLPKELSEPWDKVKISQLHKIAADAKRDIDRIFNTFEKIELEKLEKTLAKKYIDYTEFVIEQRTKIDMKQHSQGHGKKRASPERPLPNSRDFRQRSSKRTYEKISLPRRADNAQKDRKPAKVTPEARDKFRSELLGLFKKLPDYEQNVEKVSKVVYNIERGLYKDYEYIVDYAAASARVCRTVEQLRNFPLVTSRILEGKFEFHRMCKCSYERTMEKVKNLESDLEKKQTPQIKPDRLNSFLEKIETETKEEEKAKTAYLEQIALQAAAAAPLAELQANWEEEDSLESLELEGQKRVFSEDEEMVEEKKEVKKEENVEVPYNVKTEKEERKKHSSSKTQKLAPPLYDPTSTDQPVLPLIVPEGENVVYKVWNGTLENGRLQIPCEFCTNEDITAYYKLPALSSKISIDGRGKTPDVIKYLYSKSTKSGSCVLKGWVVPNSAKAAFAMEKYAGDLEKAGRCGVIDIKEIECCIYLIPWTEQNKPFIEDWGIFPIGNTFMAKFAYFIALSNIDAISAYRTLQPVLMMKMVETETKESCIEDKEGYLKKVQVLQDFIEKNKSVFLNFMRDMERSEDTQDEANTEVKFPSLEADKECAQKIQLLLFMVDMFNISVICQFIQTKLVIVKICKVRKRCPKAICNYARQIFGRARMNKMITKDDSKAKKVKILYRSISNVSLEKPKIPFQMDEKSKKAYWKRVLSSVTANKPDVLQITPLIKRPVPLSPVHDFSTDSFTEAINSFKKADKPIITQLLQCILEK
eukprot:TRINITY_DN135851_c1_g1_i1.p1 TRINITY_DN135851_c1_g1~~TRINITY_DN135851_c1_g1_i1.p1  ORF type:complete len:1065 (-),score=151.50 TRINITY_DN135851_c1_g1_i1:1689-4862(-)